MSRRTCPQLPLLAAVVSCYIAGVVGVSTVRASEEPSYLDMSIEQLLQVSVSLYSRGEETAFETPAAVYVITEEDIRRSGATNLAEALRLVPGFNVAKVNAHTWAVGARGFNGEFSNKLLVLVDGRCIYNQLYGLGGVYWAMNGLVMEDIEKIEVIRGPGGTLWGANAMNGIVNVVTKHARDTQGGLAKVGTGSEERLGVLRWGGKASENTYFRAYGKYDDILGGHVPGDGRSDDGERSSLGGFRVDGQDGPNDDWMVTGNAFSGSVNMLRSWLEPTFPYNISSRTSADLQVIDLLGRWRHQLDDGSHVTIQSFIDVQDVFPNASTNTYDVDIQHNFDIGDHEVVWGVGYRFYRDRYKSNFSLSVYPEEVEWNTYSWFVQDKIWLTPDTLALTVGSKFEHNPVTGFEMQPSIRLSLLEDEYNMSWVAVTRAVATPSRTENGLRFGITAIPTAPPVFISRVSEENPPSEKLTSYEIGHRVQLDKEKAFDVAAFMNDYSNLTAPEGSSTSFHDSAVWTDITYGKHMKGKTYGVETSVEYRAMDKWKLSGSYSLMKADMVASSPPGDATAEQEENNWPLNQAQVRSYMDLGEGFEFDVFGYYVDSLLGTNIPSYIRLDVRFGWRANKNVEVSIWGQDLLDRSHPEFSNSGGIEPQTEVERRVFGTVTYRF